MESVIKFSNSPSSGVNDVNARLCDKSSCVKESNKPISSGRVMSELPLNERDVKLGIPYMASISVFTRVSCVERESEGGKQEKEDIEKKEKSKKENL